MEALWNSLTLILGLGTEPKSLTLLQICLRGIVVFMTTLVMLRLGDRRALAQKTAFDTVLIVLLASMLARAINGSATFFATLGGGFFWCCYIAGWRNCAIDRTRSDGGLKATYIVLSGTAITNTT
jgi:hypothetical protein